MRRLANWTPLLSSSSFAGQGHSLAWLLDLGTHWQWVFLLGLVVFGALAAWLRDRRWLILLLALPLPWLTASPSAPAATHPAATLSILSANLNLDNPDAKVLLAIVQQTQPDVVMLLELTPHYAAQLKTWADYPYQALEPEDSPFGMGMVSRVPLHAVQVIKDEEDIRRMEAEISFNQRTVRLIAFHPMPPVRANFHQQRNVTLLSMAKAAQASSEPTIIAGDFNASPWSSAMVGLDGFGMCRASSLEGTWPAALGVVGLPLDQVLISPEWSVESNEVIPHPGSDHRATFTRLQLNEK